ncbi:39S ribosomal protein L3, mitochondrial [Tetranychus urticae]|uniref:Large ribosomal subunit protein uL3m n=1 Tax=Tetranychus urticae TaxID=32264 RepID=T1KMV6_TETUR|nr:39S ribosomal protein L3, mitochondrial [Tetranychus urticae]
MSAFFKNLYNKRRTTHPFRWWIKRKADSFKPELTKDNQKFIDDYFQTNFSTPLIVPDLFNKSQKVWTPESRRVGLIARKIGVYPMWLKDGQRILTTLLQVNDNHVIKCYNSEQFANQVIHQDRYRYQGLACAIIGAESDHFIKYSAGYAGLFVEAGLPPKKKLTKVPITDDALLPPGTPLYATHFRPGDWVDIFGLTIEHGFQGVVKRWDFAGGHPINTTKWKRRPGAIGHGRRAGGPHKGKKMPGHMGRERKTLNGVEIMRINTKENVIYVRGPAVPGETGNFCYIFDTKIIEKKLTEKNPPPFPTYFPGDNELPVDLYHPDVHRFEDETIQFVETEKEQQQRRTGAKIAKIRK